MNHLVTPEGPSPIAVVGANYVNQQFGFDGDYRVNQTVNGGKAYGNIFTLGDLYTQLALAHHDVVTLLDASPERETSYDSHVTTTTQQASVVYRSNWPGIFKRSIDYTVGKHERRSAESWLDEVVSTFQYELSKTGIRRKRIAGIIGYII